MAEPRGNPPRPIGFGLLSALALGTFLFGLIVTELADPRFTRPGRAQPTPSAVVAAGSGRAVPTLRPRRPTAASPAVPVPGVAAAPQAADSDQQTGAAMDESQEGSPILVVVAVTGGSGARLRAEPSATAAVLRVLDDGALLELLGEETYSEGRRWVEVKTMDGLSGWVAADFLEVAIPGT